MREKIEKPNEFTKALVRAAYPDYRGRKYHVTVVDSVDVRSFWDGGSRDYFVFVETATLKTIEVPAQHPAFDVKIPDAHAVDLPRGVVCIEHSIFCGKDSGVTIHCTRDTAGLFIPDVSKQLAAGSNG